MDTDLDRTPVVMAAAATGTAAVLVFALLPVIGGAMADRFDLDDVQTGLVASSYFSVYALIALSSGAWIRRFNWVITTRCGYAGMLAGITLCLATDSFITASIGLAIVGAGAGLLFPVSLTLVSDMHHTDRNYAIKLAAEQLIPAFLLILISSALFTGVSLRLLLLAIGALVVTCFLLSYALPAAGSTRDGALSEASGTGPLLGILSLVALAVNFAGFAGLWAFLERIATDQGFEPAFTNTWLAIGLVTSGVGPLLAAFAGERLGRKISISAASIASLLLLLVLAAGVSKSVYALVLFSLPLCYYFSISYMFAVVAAADHNGRIAGLMSFALAMGAGSGPALFGLVRDANGPVVIAMGLLIGAGAGLMIWIQTRLQYQAVGETA